MVLGGRAEKLYKSVFFLKVALSSLLLEKIFHWFSCSSAYQTQGSFERQRCSISHHLFPPRFWQRTHTCYLLSGCLSAPSSGGSPCTPTVPTLLFPCTWRCTICVRKKGNCLNTAEASVLLPATDTHASSDSHLTTWELTLPVSRTGSTQETSTDWGDMTLTLTSWASYSTGSVQNTHTQTHTVQRQKCLAPKHPCRGHRIHVWP